MEIADVVMKLIGNIEPVGETHTDVGRFENLKALTALVDELLANIYNVSKKKDCIEFSKSQAGRHADRFLCYILDEYKGLNHD